MINFLLGLPSLDLLSVDLISRASQIAYSLPNAKQRLLQYNGFTGDRDFLESLATFLTKAYNDTVKVEHLCSSPGASLMLEHMLTMLTRPQTVTRFAFFQNPTYHFVFRIFQECGFSTDQFVGIPEDCDGLDVDYLETFIKEHFEHDDGSSTRDNSHGDFYDAVLYCVPTHANPSSSILSKERREKLVTLAKQYNVLIICDDVYDLLTYQGVAPQRLVAYDFASKSDRPVVISNCSFSKILAPGLRVGWVEAQEALVKRLGLSGSYVSGSSPCNFSSVIVSQTLCTSDPQVSLQANIERLRLVLYERLVEGIWMPYQKHLAPLGCSATLPKGGYFLWLRLPTGVNCSLLNQIITEHQVDIELGTGNLFATPRSEHSDEFSDCLRLCFAHYPVQDLQAGMKLLEKVIRLAKDTLD